MSEIGLSFHSQSSEEPSLSVLLAAIFPLLLSKQRTLEEVLLSFFILISVSFVIRSELLITKIMANVAQMK